MAFGMGQKKGEELDFDKIRAILKNPEEYQKYVRGLSDEEITRNLKILSLLSDEAEDFILKSDWKNVDTIVKKIAIVPLPETEEVKKLKIIDGIRMTLGADLGDVDYFKSESEMDETEKLAKKRSKGEMPKTGDFEEAKKKFPHLVNYLADLEKKKIPAPQFVADPQTKKDDAFPNLIYPVGDPIFIHIYKEKGKFIQYIIIEPRLNNKEKKIYEQLLEKLLDKAYKEPVPDQLLEIRTVLLKLFEELVYVPEEKYSKSGVGKLNLTKAEYVNLKYFLIRDRVGYGKLEPLFYDPYLEDIHCTGVGNVTSIHKIFGMVYTSIEFVNDYELNRYIIEVTERVERPASDRHSVVDAMMPDGSRVNFIYGREVSLEGSSFTIRKFSKIPVSVTQLLSWGTMSPECAAYLWLCLENGMNIFVCGETASGKTTTLNAVATFIRPDAKIYSVEGTPEVTLPHAIWQHLLTREAGKSAKESDIGYQDLLVAALRSRPNYIIVGEIRGVEGSIAFQAMQTGHAVMSTFHAGNVVTLIQRLTGSPMNIPITFIDNLNICLIQQAVFNGTKFVRRIISLSELERYYAPANKVITREVFTRNPTEDKLLFRGLFNSYILEQKIAKVLGYKDTRQIYTELDKRAKILRKMTENKIFNYFEVWNIIKNYYNGGDEALPFKLD
jgi:archaeal flagellar protein FlaI